MTKSTFQKHRTTPAKQKLQQQHIKKYLTNKNRNINLKLLQNQLNLNDKESKNKDLKEGLKLLQNELNIYNKESKNTKGKRIALFLQSKFRGKKAKQQLSRLRNQKEVKNLSAARERVRRIREQQSMFQEDEAHQLQQESRNRSLARKKEKQNLSDKLRNMAQSVKRLTRPPLPPRKKKDSFSNTLKNLTQSLKGLFNRSIPRSRRKSSKETQMNSSRSFLGIIPNKEHWVLTTGKKAIHRKPKVRRVTKKAPKK